MYGDNRENETEHKLTLPTPRPSRLPSFDPDAYLPMIEEIDFDEPQKRALLQALWDLLVSIADLGLGLDPVQHLFAEAAHRAEAPPSSDDRPSITHCETAPREEDEEAGG